jgi:hypothetical protein
MKAATTALSAKVIPTGFRDICLPPLAAVFDPLLWDFFNNSSYEADPQDTKRHSYSSLNPTLIDPTSIAVRPRLLHHFFLAPAPKRRPDGGPETPPTFTVSSTLLPLGVMPVPSCLSPFTFTVSSTLLPFGVGLLVPVVVCLLPDDGGRLEPKHLSSLIPHLLLHFARLLPSPPGGNLSQPSMHLL